MSLSNANMDSDIYGDNQNKYANYNTSIAANDDNDFDVLLHLFIIIENLFLIIENFLIIFFYLVIGRRIRDHKRFAYVQEVNQCSDSFSVGYDR
jgi:hypothetical protein